MADDDIKQAFQALCGDYGELLDEAAHVTQSADERIGLALFKIDEACAAADNLRLDAQQVQQQLLGELLSNCHELENIFLQINLIERFVERVLETTRELEKRVETTSRAAGTVFNSNATVSSLLRSFSMNRTSSETALTESKWTPLVFEFSSIKLFERLKTSDARELGVSISSFPADSNSSVDQ